MPTTNGKKEGNISSSIYKAEEEEEEEEKQHEHITWTTMCSFFSTYSNNAFQHCAKTGKGRDKTE
jgi:hypothetical protein